MKIDRAKLNTLLRSGLKPEIKTRKELAALLCLDPTSLTRWFSNRDRLGNPRYPVVPDRHVTKIVQIFDLEPDSLSLDNREFRQYCFETALLRAENYNDAEEKALLRQENIARRKLSVPVNTTQINRKFFYVSIASVFLVLIGGWWLNLDRAESSLLDLTTTSANCWTGYSESLGSFVKEDKADPCHYDKLFYNALEQLKASNKNTISLESAQIQIDQALSTEGDYILFLSNELEKRRLAERITLNIELGKKELNRTNNSAALEYFQVAQKILDSSPKQSPKQISELSAYIKSATFTDKSEEKTQDEP